MARTQSNNNAVSYSRLAQWNANTRHLRYMKRRETSRRQSPPAPRVRYGPKCYSTSLYANRLRSWERASLHQEDCSLVIRGGEGGRRQTDRVLKIRFWNKNTAIELDYKSFGLVEPEPDDAGQDVPTFVFPEGTRIRIE